MRAITVGLCALLFVAAMPARALEEPLGEVVLSVDGMIQHRNAAEAAEFDLDMLLAIGLHKITTSTPWTEGDIAFEGVLLRDLLTAVGAEGTVLKATALNDYAIEIPAQDAEAYDVLLAFKRDGQAMGIRDRGPIWVIYPWSDEPSLRSQIFYSRSIWQLKSITVARE